VKVGIKRFVLSSLLDKAQMALMSAGRDTVPLLRGFQIEATSDSEGPVLRVVATDMSLAVVAETRLIDMKEYGQSVFPGQKLVEISKEAEEIEGEIVADDDKATITFGKATWGVNLLVGEYPPLPTRDGVEFVDVKRDTFVDALDRVYLAISGPSVRPQMFLVHVTEDRLEAADGPRYHAVDLPTGLEIDVPGAAVPDLVRQLKRVEDEVIGVADTENHLLFLVGENLYLVTKTTYEFPEVGAEFMNVVRGNNMELSFDKDQVQGAIRRVKVNADPDTAQVFFRLQPDNVALLARDKFGNYASHELDAYWKGDDRLFSLNWHFFLDVIQAARSGTIEFLLGEDQNARRSALLFKEDGFTAILSQLRVDPSDSEVLKAL
jgi:DNA polymerase III sliding clamp (beta) subunit (PCNA family)